jgi:hypothetical protein
VKTWESSDDVAVLLVEVLESRILAEDIHALPLTEYHANRAVLENQPRLVFQKN